MVKPDQVSEDQMVILARELAKKIEEEMEYPGRSRCTSCARRPPSNTRNKKKAPLLRGLFHAFLAFCPAPCYTGENAKRRNAMLYNILAIGDVVGGCGVSCPSTICAP